MLEVDRAPSRAPSRSTTWRKRAPWLDPAPRGVDRVGVVDGLVVVVAAQQPHRTTAANVDRRIEDHAAETTRAQMLGEVREQAQPGGARLLGVELDAVERRPSDRAGEALAVLGGARARRRRRAGRGVNVCTK